MWCNQVAHSAWSAEERFKSYILDHLKYYVNIPEQANGKPTDSKSVIQSSNLCSGAIFTKLIWPDQDKLKKSIAAKNSQKVKLHNNLQRIKYSFKVKHYKKVCPICKKQFIVPESEKNTIYCSMECYKLDKHCQFRRVNRNLKCSGYNKGSGFGKKGWYKGIWCDSSWQLAYVVYYLDHNLPIKKCTQKREYIFEGKKYYYTPDFETDVGIVEIKGYENEKWKSKEEQHSDVIVLKEEDLKEIFLYVINKYGKDYTYLYESK